MVVLLLLAGFLMFAASAAAQPVVPSPPGETRLAWNHSGENVRWFDIVVDGRDRIFQALPCMVSAGYYEVPLPVLTPGTRRLTVEACNMAGCGASDPLVVTVVSAPIGTPASPALTGPLCPPLLPGTGQGGSSIVRPYKGPGQGIPPGL